MKGGDIPETHSYGNHLVIAPQSPVVEIGTNFTATCMIINTAEVTAGDLYWNLSISSVIPEQYYTKINASALGVTVPITREESEWLLCHCKKRSPYVVLNKSMFTHGIWLTKGCKFSQLNMKHVSCF
ncbi:hypothetical protein GOODEAATRI_009054 [Goodea atripinnis]|uniref:Immunoglobulin C2-set-like ligand-binding domain-containing protein n=1 Tax=Goodea atripinnis TaxID=208336 RepID=A0ABV0P2M1_9TELE